MISPGRGLCVLAALLCSAGARAGEFALYPTGPAQDAAFIRFVNAGPAPLDVIAKAGQAPLRIDNEQPVSQMFAVDSGKPVTGSLVSNGQTLALKMNVGPGEFATVVVVPDGKGIRQVEVRETPDDFNGLKASLAFFNVDPSCSDATLRLPGRPGDVFKEVPVNSMQRRPVNPVNLSLQLLCGDADVGTPLALGELKAGERYSVLLVPSVSGPRLLGATDSVSH